MGLLGAYFVLVPRAKVLTLIFLAIVFIREIPAVWFFAVRRRPSAPPSRFPVC
jgi:membrane associated rhomboid family serine protease